jgi:hypothetical protein
MSIADLEHEIADYFTYWEKVSSTSRADRLEAKSGNRLDDWMSAAIHFRDGPADEEVWAVVLALVDAAPDDAALGHVAAGPLEDLAWYHAEQFGDRLVEKTRADPKFRTAMAGILGWDRVAEPFRSRLLAIVGASSGDIAAR